MFHYIRGWLLRTKVQHRSKMAMEQGSHAPSARFTKRARTVLVLAQSEASRQAHTYIGTEHLLLGLLRERGGIAGCVLTNLGVTLPQARRAVERIVGQGDGPPCGTYGLTPRAKRVIGRAGVEARRLHHSYIGTEHLLLALVREGGVAGGVLDELGVRLETVRTAVLRAVADYESS